MGKNAKLKEKQKWSNEKLHLENARELLGIYFIDPQDKEVKETIKNARKKLETSVAPAMPCKISKNKKNCGNSDKSNKIKSKLACILEASESTRPRMGESLPNHHEDHIAGQGDNSLQHCNLVHKFIPVPQAMKIPAAKAGVDKEWEKLEKIPAWDLTKVRSKKEVIDEARTKGAEVHFASLRDICHLKNAELEAKHRKKKGRVVFRGVFVKDDSGSYAVIHRSRIIISNDSSNSHGFLSRLPGCVGQASNAISAYTQVKMGAAYKLMKIPTSECPDVWIRLAPTNGLNRGSVSKTSNKTSQQPYKVCTPCFDDHHFEEEEMKSVAELSHVCSQIVLKCLHLERIGRPDILWSVNKLARSITKWTKACDKRLNRLISYIHHTCEYKQYCYVGNTAKQCRLGLFQDSDFAGDLEDSKSTSGGTLCVFESHTLVPMSWMCEKQTSVSRSSTESEIISLDAGLRLVINHDRTANLLFAVTRIMCATNLEE